MTTGSAKTTIELHAGFHAACEGDLEILLEDWQELHAELEAAMLELRESYANGPATTDVWTEVVEPTVRHHRRGNFELVCSFIWQHPKDSQTVTMVVEDGELSGVAIDG